MNDTNPQENQTPTAPAAKKSTVRRAPSMPYLSMVMAIVLIAFGINTNITTDKNEAKLVQQLMEEEVSRVGVAQAEERRAEIEAQAAAAPDIVEKREEANWQFIAALILFAVILGFFTLNTYLTRRARERGD